MLWPIKNFQTMLKGDLSAGKGREPGWQWDRDPTGMWPGARGSRTPWEAGVRFKSTARTPGAPTQHHHPQGNLVHTLLGQTQRCRKPLPLLGWH